MNILDKKLVIKKRKARDTFIGILIGIPLGFAFAGIFIMAVLLYCRMAGPL